MFRLIDEIMTPDKECLSSGFDVPNAFGPSRQCPLKCRLTLHLLFVLFLPPPYFLHGKLIKCCLFVLVRFYICRSFISDFQ